jgi:hypothetical protein
MSKTTKDSCVLCGTVDQPEYQHDSADHPAWRGEEPFTHGDLMSMAVSPSQRGAYSHSPLGDGIGLHVHDSDPENVHVYVTGFGKVAEVHPGRTDILAGSYLAVESAAAARDLVRRLPNLEESTA